MSNSPRQLNQPVLVGLDLGARQSVFSSSSILWESPSLLSLDEPSNVGSPVVTQLSQRPEQVAQLATIFLGLSPQAVQTHGYDQLPFMLRCPSGEGIWFNSSLGEKKVEQVIAALLDGLLIDRINAPLCLSWVCFTSYSIAARWRWRELLEERSVSPPLSFSAPALAALAGGGEGLGAVFSFEAEQLGWSLLERGDGCVELLYQRARLGWGRLSLELQLMRELWSLLGEGSDELPQSPHVIQQLWWAAESLLSQLDMRREAEVSWPLGGETERVLRLNQRMLRKLLAPLEEQVTRWVDESLLPLGLKPAELRWLMLPEGARGLWSVALRRTFPCAELIEIQRNLLAEQARRAGEALMEGSLDAPVLLERSVSAYSLSLGESVRCPLLDADQLLPATYTLRLPPPGREISLTLWRDDEEGSSACVLGQQTANEALQLRIMLDRYGCPQVSIHDAGGTPRLQLRPWLNQSVPFAPPYSSANVSPRSQPLSFAGGL